MTALQGTPSPRKTRYNTIDNFFGFGSTNGHVALEGGPKPDTVDRTNAPRTNRVTGHPLRGMRLDPLPPANKLGVSSRKTGVHFVPPANSERPAHTIRERRSLSIKSGRFRDELVRVDSRLSNSCLRPASTFYPPRYPLYSPDQVRSGITRSQDGAHLLYLRFDYRDGGRISAKPER